MIKHKLLFCFLITVIILAMMSTTAFATTYYYSSGYQLYHDSGFNGWIINSCSLDSDEISLPANLLDETVSTVGGSCFENNSKLRYIKLSDSITALGAYSFSGCSSLSEVVWNKNLKRIYPGAFRYCNSLTNVDLTNTKLVSVDNAAFYSCEKLRMVKLPDTVETISSNSFANCLKLSYIIIPSSVTSIDGSAFTNHPDLTIYCYRNSYAHEFARDNNISFSFIGPLYGDANGDGRISVTDVTYIQKHKAFFDGYDFDDYTDVCADVNKDGKVNIRDATLIQMYIARVISSF